MQSGIWSLSELAASHLLRLASNLILTRLLMPEAFGLMAMVTTVQIGVTMISDLGIRQSVIRATDAEDPVFLRTAWTVQFLRGLAVAAIVTVVGLALGIIGQEFARPGTVYADPLLPWLVIASALTLLIDAGRSANVLLADRRLQLSRMVLMNIAAQVVSVTVMISIALQWASPWALLIGSLTGAAFRTALSHLIFLGPAMRFSWDPEIRSELWRFGRWIIGSSALSFITRHADRLILGGLMSSSSLGLYIIALLWVQAYGSVISRLSSRVGLAALSEIRRERPEDLVRLLRKSERAIGAICLAGFSFFFFLGPEFIALLYSSDYQSAGEFIPLLGVLILVQRFSLLSELLVAEGYSFQLMLSNAASAVAACAAVPLGYALLGVNGAIAGSLLAPMVGTAVRLHTLTPLLGTSIRKDWAWLAAVVVLTAAITALDDPI